MQGWRKSYLRYQSLFLNIVAVYKQRQDLRAFLEIILSIGTVSLFAAFAIRPTVLTITQLLRDIDAKQSTIKAMDQKIQDINSAQRIYSEEASRIALLSSTIPDFPNPDTFSRQLEGAVSKNGVVLLSFGVGEVTLVGKELPPKNIGDKKPLAEGADEMTISLSASGGYSNLSGFLKDIENLRRPIKVDTVSLNSTRTETARTLVLVVSGRVPYIQ